MTAPITLPPTKKRRRRSPEFMSRVYRVMDTGYTFMDAVRIADDNAEKYARMDAEKAAEQERQRNQLEAWNATVPPGTKVMARSVVDGPEFETRTRSKAWALGHGRPVVLIEGKAGGWGLDFLRVVPG